MKTYIFFREEAGKEFWYPIEERNDKAILKHVELNPGTKRVEDINGRIVWRPQ